MVRIHAGEPPQFGYLQALLFCFLDLPVRTPLAPQSGLELFAGARGLRSADSLRLRLQSKRNR